MGGNRQRRGQRPQAPPTAVAATTGGKTTRPMNTKKKETCLSKEEIDQQMDSTQQNVTTLKKSIEMESFQLGELEEAVRRAKMRLDQHRHDLTVAESSLKALQQESERAEDPLMDLTPDQQKHYRNTLRQPLCIHYPTTKGCGHGFDCRFHHPYSAAEGKSPKKPNKASAGKTTRTQEACSICYEDPTSIAQGHNRRAAKFCLLTNCDHVFCISCIDTWVKEQRDATEPNCPVCRQPVGMFVTSCRPLKGKNRELAIADEKERRNRSQCKTYAEKGSCPHRSKCYYAHFHPRTKKDQRASEGPPVYAQGGARHWQREFIEVIARLQAEANRHGESFYFDGDSDDEDEDECGSSCSGRSEYRYYVNEDENPLFFDSDGDPFYESDLAMYCDW